MVWAITTLSLRRERLRLPLILLPLYPIGIDLQIKCLILPIYFTHLFHPSQGINF